MELILKLAKALKDNNLKICFDEFTDNVFVECLETNKQEQIFTNTDWTEKELINQVNKQI